MPARSGTFLIVAVSATPRFWLAATSMKTVFRPWSEAVHRSTGSRWHRHDDLGRRALPGLRHKLQEYAGRACRKRSEGKSTWPGRKQVYRRLGQDGRLDGDTITVEGTTEPGRPLLHQVMRAGSRVAPDPSMDTIRQRAGLALAELPDTLRRLDQTASYEVRIAEALTALAQQVDRHT